MYKESEYRITKQCTNGGRSYSNIMNFMPSYQVIRYCLPIKHLWNIKNNNNNNKPYIGHNENIKFHRIEMIKVFF